MHLLTALEEFNYLNIRFVSVQDQIDTTSPMGKAMFTLIGAMAELELSTSLNPQNLVCVKFIKKLTSKLVVELSERL